jgi:hypothetical protein
MKINILCKEETYRLKHISLTLQVEADGKLYKIRVIVIEDYDIKHNSYTYEFEGYNWLSDIKGINANELEIKVENYLIDNIEDIVCGTCDEI